MKKILFFLHIPRTAGTTLDSILVKNFPENSILKIYKKEEYKTNRFRDYDQLKDIKYITGHLFLEKYDPPMIYNKEVDAFTFLRNPINRLVSEYIFYKTWPKQHLYQYINENNISFRNYIQSSDQLLKYRGKNFMTRCISGKGFKYNKPSLSALAVAKRNLDKNFFFFGITEQFAESIVLLSKKIGIDNILHEQRNKLNTKLKDEISEEDLNIARELNQVDSALYNFAVDLFNERINNEGSDFKTAVEEFKLNNKEYQNKLLSSKETSDEELIYLPK